MTNGNIDPLYIPVPLYSTPPVTYNQCSSAITCIDHPATIDLSRLASVLGAPAAALDNVPLPGHDHLLTTRNGDQPEWWNVIVIPVTSAAGLNSVETAKSYSAVKALENQPDSGIGVAGVGEVPTNAYLWFQTLPGAGPATPGPVQTNCVTTLPSGTVVGGAALDDGTGYYEVDAAGDVAAFGAATCYGSLTGIKLNQPIVGMAVDRATGGYWLVGLGRRRVRLQCSLPRLDRWHAPQQAGGRHDRHPQRDRLLARRLGRRRVLLQRPVPGVDREHQAQQAGRRHGSRPDDRRLLAGRLRRRGVLLQRPVLGLDREHPPQQAGRGDRTGVRRERLPPDRLRRRGVLLQRPVLRVDREHHSSTSRSSAGSTTTPTTATGWWPPTAGSSPSAHQ